MPITRSDCCLCFWPTGYRFEVPMTPSLSSVNLLVWLTELRETFYLLHYQFIIKRYNFRNSQMEEMHRARYMGRDTEFPSPLRVPSLPASTCVHQPGSSPTPVFLDFYGGLITQASLIKSLAIGYWLNLQPLLSLEVPWQPASYLGCGPKFTSLT